MKIQSVLNECPSCTVSTLYQKSNRNIKTSAIPQNPLAATNSVYFGSESVSVKSLYMEYTNKDGDKLVLNIEQAKYEQLATAIKEPESKEEWEKLIAYIKDDFLKLKQEIIRNFLDSLNEENQDKIVTSHNTEKIFDESEIPGLPEYWNAENTSQRIVDFATSFFGAFKGNPEEFVSIIKDAIEEGFSQAREILGKLPSPVENLINKTYTLVMEKIDAWAQKQGINVESKQQAVAV